MGYHNIEELCFYMCLAQKKVITTPPRPPLLFIYFLVTKSKFLPR